LTRLEEQAEQSALSDNVAKRAKGKEWNQYQQNDNASGNQLVIVPPPTAAIESMTPR
jgi:hypothetical protein